MRRDVYPVGCRTRRPRPRPRPRRPRRPRPRRQRRRPRRRRRRQWPRRTTPSTCTCPLGEPRRYYDASSRPPARPAACWKVNFEGNGAAAVESRPRAGGAGGGGGGRGGFGRSSPPSFPPARPASLLRRGRLRPFPPPPPATRAARGSRIARDKRRSRSPWRRGGEAAGEGEGEATAGPFKGGFLSPAKHTRKPRWPGPRGGGRDERDAEPGSASPNGLLRGTPGAPAPATCRRSKSVSLKRTVVSLGLQVNVQLLALWMYHRETFCGQSFIGFNIQRPRNERP